MKNPVAVTLAAGRYLPSAYIQAMELRFHGCTWPHILFHLPGEEIPPLFRQLFRELNVEIRVVEDYLGHHFTAKRSIFQMFPAQEVLFMDADNIPLMNPEIIRASPEFQAAGSMFWRDMERMTTDDFRYPLMGLDPVEDFAQESGQLLLHTGKCARALESLRTWDVANWREMYAKVNGDKDFWRLIWLKTGTPWVWGSARLDVLMAEHNLVLEQYFGDKKAFHHRCLSEFDMTTNWWRPGIPLRFFQHLEYLHSRGVR